MRKTLLIYFCLLLVSSAGRAQKQVWVLPQQVPQGINYQAAVRDNSGNAVADAVVSFRVSILKGKPDGPSQYTETHQVTTNAHGLANFVIFGGTHVSGSAGDITWTQEGPYFLKVEMDREGGSNYQLMGTSEMLSVPYALNANYSLYAYSSGPVYEVGQLAEGGIVIATWDGGRHGWVMAEEDETPVTHWNEAYIACQNKTTGGYRDWMLPTLAQLRLIFEERGKYGEFPSLLYFSSTESMVQEEPNEYGEFGWDYGMWGILFKGITYDGKALPAGTKWPIYEYIDDDGLAPGGVRAVRVF